MRHWWIGVILLIFGSGSATMGRDLKRSEDKNINWITECPIAHRGLFSNTEGCPENSLKAFSHAIDRGYAIELDVRLSKDGQVVVHHDASTRRMTQKSVQIAETTLRDLKEFTLLNSKEKLPTLEEVLALVDGRVPLYIEIKKTVGAVTGLDTQVKNLLESYRGPFAVISFEPECVAYFKNHAPNMIRGLNIHFPTTESLYHQPIIGDIIQLASMLKNIFVTKPHFLILNYKEISSRNIAILRRFLPITSYSIYSELDSDMARQKGITNIIFENIRP